MAVVRIEGSQSCRAEVLDAGRHALAQQYRLISRIAALDVSDEWAADGAASCAHWVAVALDTMVSTAREWVRIGRALRVLDEIDAAFAAGRLSYSKVRALTRVATAETQGELLEMAEHVPAGRLAHALAAWRMQRETPAETEARQEANMALWWSDDADGMGVLTVRLPPAEMAYVRAAVEGRLRAWRPDASTDSVPTVAIARPPACQRVPRAVPSRLRWRDGRGRAPRARRRLHDGRRFPGGRVRRSPHCADRLPAGADSRRGGPSDQCFGPTPKSNDAATACRTRTRSALCRLRRDRPPRVRPRPGMGAER